jgi:hypothetical protein
MTHKDNELPEPISIRLREIVDDAQVISGYEEALDIAVKKLEALFTTTLQQREREAVAEGFNKAIELVEDITSDRNTEEQTIKNAARAIKNKKELRLVLGNILANDMYYSGQDFILKQLKKYIGTLDRSTNSNDTLSNVNNKENN